MTAPGPPQHANLFHTGIVVADLDAAKVELGEQLGLTWFEGGAEVTLLTEDGPQVVESAYAMSREGPHHVELAQEVPGTIWTAPAAGHAHQPHHLGYWVDSVPEASAVLESAGAPRDTAVAMTEDDPPICAYHRTPGGLYVEIVSRAMRRVLLPSMEVAP